jgi:hypothetical protein
MNFDAIAPNLNNLGRIHIYLLHLFLLVDYGYCRGEFLAQQPQKAGTRRCSASFSGYSPQLLSSVKLQQ